MSSDDEFNARDILADGVIMNCFVRYMNSEELVEDEREDRAITGNLSMVCTYPEDYKRRQAVFSCLTCQKETGKQAGICYGCVNECHKDHDVLELYTKRLFCCDCGNSKFKETCKLFENKSPVNTENRYGKNFDGLYCTCKRPYCSSEDDATNSAEMFQCFMCEDWFHADHVGFSKPDDGEYVEMCCPACSINYPFIGVYQYVCDQDAKQGELQKNADSNATVTQSEVDPGTHEALRPALVNNVNMDETAGCYYEKIESGVPKDLELSRPVVFLSVDWRPMLCRCKKCKGMYKKLKCGFLLDEEDSLRNYTNKNLEEYDQNRPDLETELRNAISLRASVETAHHVVSQIVALKRRGEELDKGVENGTVTSEEVNKFFTDFMGKRHRSEDADEH